ncbi:MAG: type II toxin-antitoxin system HicA family toxin [Candidatus Hydrogenedens sp.]|nr:type II toxin-antitoxin system HicA family toxin [Candidatus Hydrogenedentota bacterium]NLF56277.1 type II toxin-antitoxin system HicA family toxin [Candidatus Hydrogenedens sp.]
MSRLPRIRATEAIAALRKVGFNVVRIKGSHHVLAHADGRMTVIPVHAGEDLGPGLLRQILRDADLTCDQFSGLL